MQVDKDAGGGAQDAELVVHHLWLLAHNGDIEARIANPERVEVGDERIEDGAAVAEVGADDAGHLCLARRREALDLVDLVIVDAGVVDYEDRLDGAVEACRVSLALARAPPHRRAPLGRGLRGLEQVLIPRLARVPKIAVDRDKRAVRVGAHNRCELDEADVEVPQLRDIRADEQRQRGQRPLWGQREQGAD